MTNKPKLTLNGSTLGVLVKFPWPDTYVAYCNYSSKQIGILTSMEVSGNLSQRTLISLARELNCALMEGDFDKVGILSFLLSTRKASKDICRKAALHPIMDEVSNTPTQKELTL